MKNDHDKIKSMSIEEQTERYITRRSAELRGERELRYVDEATEQYIQRRIAELRGRPVAHTPIKDEPYIRLRIAYLRASGL